MASRNSATPVLSASYACRRACPNRGRPDLFPGSPDAAHCRWCLAREAALNYVCARSSAHAILRYMVPSSAAKLLAQMRRGAIEFCVLALLRDRDRYGLDLARTLAADGLVTGEGTIYPLLARLRQEGLVETTWHESPQGPPRRYYQMTQDGRAALDAFIVQWRQFRDAVDAVLEGDQTP
jgi:PadR family transcriptional regulator, regulatory protein PadR